MTSIVRSERIADCPFSVAVEYADNFFKRDADELGRFTVHLGVLRRAVTFSFGVHYDVGDGARGQNELHFTWSARSRLLPNLSGILQFAIASYKETRIVLAGTYEPPLGPLGSIFDAVIGHRLAAATANDFVARIAGALEAQERAFRARHPNAS
jgi:hypothetical protein